MMDELTAVDSDKKKKAMSRLESMVRVGAEQQKKVATEALETVIVDKLWYPAKLHFFAEGNTDDSVAIRYQDEPQKVYQIHKHAMGQMATIVDVPRAYVTRLRQDGGSWRRELLARIFNDHFTREEFGQTRNKPTAFLRRAVGDQIRGFQSRSFGRNLATAPMLRAFIEECAKHGAAPVEARSNDIMASLKCVMPYVFEPVDGEFIAFGVSFKNSDFGAAKLTVAGTILRISSGTMTVTEGALRKTHLGRQIDTDDELILSDKTINKEIEAAQSAIADIVKATLSMDSVKNTLINIVEAHQRGLNWFSLSSVLSKVLSKSELEFAKQLLAADDLMDLPPLKREKGEDPKATPWWAANLVGWFANKEEDAERRQALQELAGDVLSL